ncbi:N-acetylmuramoyl-L-alanine amidase [Symbiobacterium terraclitae]|uniref:N-acetylmuramoyl-L-alanine amidase n=1 Tax=Symbiobacterium terraclitae TaxID=557451 RepID=A0ABS4JQ12_9FIRM|nr:N-acetylmuramoyl-L-alanine amidase [Symbiobacterium terraclitae]
MRRLGWGQALLVGLVLLVLAAALRAAWVGRQAARPEAPEEPQRPPGPLAGMVIVVDPGHGGWDPGAVVDGVKEKELTLQVALLLKEMLEERDAKVILTRSDDSHFSRTVREDLKQRVAMAAEHRADIYLSLHANKDRCNCWGAQTFYQKGGRPEGKILAMAIQNRLRALTETTRYALPGDYFVLRTSQMPATIVEMGFLSNRAERERLQQPEYQRTVARAIAEGVEDYRKQIAEQPGVVPENPADPSPGR